MNRTVSAFLALVVLAAVPVVVLGATPDVFVTSTQPYTPWGGDTVYTNTPELRVDVFDDDFGSGGHSVTVTFYVDGQKTKEVSGITDSASVAYEAGPLTEGEHNWYVIAEDSDGNTRQIADQTFYVDHRDPYFVSGDQSPDGGEIVYTSTPELNHLIGDDDLTADVSDGDTLTVGWYIDGNLVKQESGIDQTDLNNNGNIPISYETGNLAEGDHTWSIKVADQWGGTTTSPSYSFTVDHHDPIVDTGSAYPQNNETFADSTVDLSVDIADKDFGGDGDTLAVGWYVDGNLVNTQTGINSNQTVSYTTSSLPDGTHNWSVNVTDSYGGYTDPLLEWDFTVDHEPPAVSNPSIDGTTYYARNTLAVDVTDADFSGEGDTVEVAFFLNGTAVRTQNITSNQRVEYTTDAFVDGNYTWWVEAGDSYGYTTSTPDYDLNITHDTPELSNPSLDGVTHYENNTLSMNLSDRDFAFEGDTVDVGFYVNDTLVNTQEVTANGTVSYDAGPYEDGAYTWHIEAEDDYNNSVTSQTWDMIVEHDPPSIDESVASPTNGTVSNYENIELTIGVDDADFARDGDTVDIVWYVNGQAVSVSTVIQNGTYSYETAALADGNYTWRVGVYDDYGYVRNSTTRTFEVKHFPSRFDNSSVSPTGTIRTQTPPFTIDMTDRDFAFDGDSVDVGLYINESDGGNPYLVGVDTLYQNRTVEITPTEAVSGNATYWFRAVDDYGYDVNSTKTFIEAPNSLYLHDAVDPHDLLNGTAFEATLTGSNESVGFDTGSDGSVEFGDFPKGESYVFTITANGYYQRGVYVDDLYARSVIFLINDSADVVSNRVVVDDVTGEFDENAIVELETVINTTRVDNMPDDGPQWVTVGGDRLGLSGTTDVTLREGARYRFTVLNEQGFSRTLGYYTARQNGTVELTIGDISYPAPEGTGYTWTAYTNDTDSGPSATFAYNDPQQLTDSVTVTMTTRQTGEVIGTDTLQAGTFGEAVVTFPINNSVYETQDIVIEWTAYRDGEKITGKRLVSGQSSDQQLPISGMWQSVLYAGVMILLAFMGGMFLGVPALFILLGAGAGLAAFLGIGPPALGFGVGILMIGLGATMQRWRNQTVQPQ